jgi:hypothetical protein
MFPTESLAVMVSSLVPPAITVAEPVTSSLAAVAALTDHVSVSVIVPFTVSVTETVWLPEVISVTPLVKA